MSAWVLPDHLADVLPKQARHVEELRRVLLDTARGYGFELVMPPLVEHLESLLSGTGEALDLQTFKLVDQLSGRTLGLRADTTPQVARIDAHLLNRVDVARLCYAGPVLLTRPSGPHGTREPLQFGAEIYGHAGIEADLEVLQLALDCLDVARVAGPSVDLTDARIVRGLLAEAPCDAARLALIRHALALKDATALAELARDFPALLRKQLAALPELYGDAGVLQEAARVLPDTAPIRAALADLRWLAQHRVGDARLSFDLADLRGYSYYSGARFTIYAQGARDALVRGGRYDEVGAVFGRNRPAVGFSLDVKALVEAAAADGRRGAIRAPWGVESDLRAAIRELRAAGETVVCVLPGHGSESDEFDCDRELVAGAAGWRVQPVLQRTATADMAA